jgi:tetratricopeptide (TPR) repeat protein
MHDATSLAREAWELISSESVEAAIAKYHQVLLAADPDVHDMWQLHGELGSALAKAGRYEDAIEHHLKSAEAALRQGESDASTTVQVARYFAGSLLLHLGRAADALTAIDPSLNVGGTAEPALRTLETAACWRLGYEERARKAARLAIDTARNDKQRQRVEEQVSGIFQDGAG